MITATRFNFEINVLVMLLGLNTRGEHRSMCFIYWMPELHYTPL